MTCKDCVKCSRKVTDWHSEYYGVNTEEVSVKIFSLLNKLSDKGVLSDNFKAKIEITPCLDDNALEITVKG